MRIDDLDFIQGKVTERVFSFYDKDIKRTSLLMEIEKDGEKRIYPPIFFLDLVLTAYYRNIDKKKDISQRIKTIYEAKVAVTHYISLFTEENSSIQPFTPLDFTGILNQINSVIESIKLEVDLQKYNLEVKKLKIETRKYKEVIYLFLFLSSLITTSFLVLQNMGYLPIYRKELPIPKTIHRNEERRIKTDSQSNLFKAKPETMRNQLHHDTVK